MEPIQILEVGVVCLANLSAYFLATSPIYLPGSKTYSPDNWHRLIGFLHTFFFLLTRGHWCPCPNSQRKSNSIIDFFHCQATFTMQAGSERNGDLKSLGLLPMVTGIGHLLPAIGALQAVGGMCKEEIALLVMVASTTVLVDCKSISVSGGVCASHNAKGRRLTRRFPAHDKYKDLPPERRPRRWVWRLWVSLMTGVASTSTYMCGLYTAIRIHRFLAIGMLWGIPCMPGFSPSEGLRIYKPKAVVFPRRL